MAVDRDGSFPVPRELIEAGVNFKISILFIHGARFYSARCVTGPGPVASMSMVRALQSNLLAVQYKMLRKKRAI